MSTELILPKTIAFTHDDGPEAVARTAEDASRGRTVRSVMFLDKLQQEQLVKTETPKLVDADMEAARQLDKIQQLAEAHVDSARKKSTKLTTAAAALVDLGFKKSEVRVDMTMGEVITEKQGKILTVVTVSMDNTSGYARGSNATTNSLQFTPEMRKLLKAYRTAKKESERARKVIIDAKAKLSERANRMADAEGALALNSLTKAEKKNAALLLGQLNDDKPLDARKLLGHRSN